MESQASCKSQIEDNATTKAEGGREGREGERVRGRKGEKGAKLLILKIEEGMQTKKYKKPPENGKGKEMDSFLEFQKECSPAYPFKYIWPPEL
jgi:hypothetical protein